MKTKIIFCVGRKPMIHLQSVHQLEADRFRVWTRRTEERSGLRCVHVVSHDKDLFGDDSPMTILRQTQQSWMMASPHTCAVRYLRVTRGKRTRASTSCLWRSRVSASCFNQRTAASNTCKHAHVHHNARRTHAAQFNSILLC